MANGSQGYTNAVERTLDILEFLAIKGCGVSVIELNQALGVNRTSVYSILKTLISKGYIRKNGDGKYSLTGRCMNMGKSSETASPLFMWPEA